MKVKVKDVRKNPDEFAVTMEKIIDCQRGHFMEIADGVDNTRDAATRAMFWREIAKVANELSLDIGTEKFDDKEFFI